MLALDLAQYQPIAIAMLVAFCVLKLLQMKQQHRPRELFKDESSKCAVDIDNEIDVEAQLIQHAFPASANVSGEELVAANAALQTKAAVLDQLLIEADREAGLLRELLHEARSIRIPGVLREDCHAESSQDADDQLRLATGTDSQPTRVNKQQFVRLLHQSGFSPDEVAKAVKLPIEIVLGMLGQSGEQDRTAG